MGWLVELAVALAVWWIERDPVGRAHRWAKGISRSVWLAAGGRA